jgi:cytochrome c-type biogenesis protein CcmE
MTQSAWEKRDGASTPSAVLASRSQRWQFMLGGIILIAAVAYLILSSTASGARYFLTVDEVVNSDDYIGQTVRLSGAVIGDTINYDGENLILDFTIAHIPAETEDLALTLYEAANNPDSVKLKVHLEGQVKPDLLQHEAQAIISGQMSADGVFYASELLLKCPSRYGESVPEQVSDTSAS